MNYLTGSTYGVCGIIMAVVLLGLVCYNAWQDDADDRRKGYYVLACALVLGVFIYDFLDSSSLFRAAVVPADRSVMNVPFVTGSKELDAEVVSAAKAAGFDNLKGHKSVGGLRASIYNAMPKEGVEALVNFLRKYEKEHA